MTGPLKYHGGKHYLAQKLVRMMPPHTHYVEPYCGGLSVLLAKPHEGVSEVVNDINQDLTTFWRILQDRDTFTLFERAVQAVPFSEFEWKDAHRTLDKSNPTLSAVPMVDRAVKFFILCRQSLAGRCENFAPLTRNRTRRRMNEQASAWLNAVDGLVEVHERLRRVVILNRPAVEVIRSQDGPETMFYLDPPYLPETRADADTWGEFEMTEEQHIELLETICSLQGKVVLSGYRSSLYDSHLGKWKRHEFELPNNAANGVIKRRMTETVWCNFKRPMRRRRAA